MNRRPAGYWLLLAICMLAWPGCARTMVQRQASNGSSSVSRHISEPDKHEGQLSVARLMERNGETEQAQQMYLTLIEKQPNDPVPYHRLGVMAAQDKKWRLAEEYFNKAYALAPSSTDLLSDMGYFYYLQNRNPEAENILRQALAIDADDRTANNNLGLVLSEQQRFDDSFDAFRRAGSEAEARANLAYVLAQQGRYGKSLEAYSKALSLDPKMRPAAMGMLQVAQNRPVPPGNQPTNSPQMATNLPQSATILPQTATNSPRMATIVPQPDIKSPQSATIPRHTATNSRQTGTNSPPMVTILPQPDINSPQLATNLAQTATNSRRTGMNSPPLTTILPQPEINSPQTATIPPQTATNSRQTATNRQPTPKRPDNEAVLADAEGVVVSDASFPSPHAVPKAVARTTAPRIDTRTRQLAKPISDSQVAAASWQQERVGPNHPREPATRSQIETPPSKNIKAGQGRELLTRETVRQAPSKTAPAIAFKPSPAGSSSHSNKSPRPDFAANTSVRQGQPPPTAAREESRRGPAPRVAAASPPAKNLPQQRQFDEVAARIFGRAEPSAPAAPKVAKAPQGTTIDFKTATAPAPKDVVAARQLSKIDFTTETEPAPPKVAKVQQCSAIDFKTQTRPAPLNVPKAQTSSISSQIQPAEHPPTRQYLR